MLYARFAPTPSGFLHEGNALNFIFTWLYARKYGAKIGLRIDDLDPFRCKDKYVSYIFKALEWLNLTWDEPPFSAQEFYNFFSYESKRQRYEKFLLHVKALKSTYVCSCSRKQLQNSSCTCKDKNIPLVQNKSALKLNLKAFKDEVLFDVNCANLADPVLWRKEGVPAYQLASLCDDSLKAPCLLVRGEDLRESSAIQMLLAKTLNLKPFCDSIFIHHPLIADKSGKKLSKSHLAPPLDFSKTPQFLYVKASKMLGLESCYDLDSLLEAFGKKESFFGSNTGGEK
jgi:glutamyl/glutaminyl-tRNA synthetase